MTDFIQIETPAGLMFVEVDKRDREQGVKLLTGKDKETAKFENVVNAIKTNADFVIKNVQSLGLSEIEMSVGLKCGIEGGNSFWGIAKVSAEASYNIKIVWKREEKST